ncbi:unnamed protein product [Malus baccata var. baccata]
MFGAIYDHNRYWALRTIVQGFCKRIRKRLRASNLMAATLTKRALSHISKSLPKEHPPCIQSCLSRACFSTSYESVQDPRNRPPTEAGRHGAATEGREGDTSIDDMSGVTGFVAGTARQSAAKATGVAEDLVDMARETNVAWDSVKNTTRKVTDTLVAEADANVVDTAEYRTIEDHSKFADQNDHHQKGHI